MDLGRAQAEWTLGIFPAEDLPELAAQMLMRGFESPAILELASFHRPRAGDVPDELVARAFLDCGRPPLARQEAAERRILDLLRDNSPPAMVLAEFGRYSDRPYALADDEKPFSELARLYVDWDEGRDDPLMMETLEGHLSAVAGRLLLYFAESRKPGRESGIR